MDSDSDSPSSSSDKSRERILRENPRKTLAFAFKPFLVIAAFSILFPGVAPSSDDFESTYDRHCGSFVPRSRPLSDRLSSAPLELRFGFFSGGAPILSDSLGSVERSFIFAPGQRIESGELSGTVFLRGSYLGNAVQRRPDLPSVRFRGSRSSRLHSRRFFFRLRGFWSEVSGELCMVGSGLVRGIGKPRRNSVSVVLKLTYPRNSTIYGSLVRGSLESLESLESDGYFSPVAMLALVRSHEYSLVKKESRCLSRNGGGEGEEEGVSVSELSRKGCSVLRYSEKLELEYGGDCVGGVGDNCNPIGRGLGFVPNHMFFYKTQCSDDGNKWEMYLVFPNSNDSYYGSHIDPNTTLVAEGEWNEKQDRFCGVACRILNVSGGLFDGAYVGDCSIGLSLRIPSSLSLRNRGNVVGKIWSSEDVNSSGHFGEIGFSGFDRTSMRLNGVKYEYTVINDAFKKSCARRNKVSGEGKKYPAEDSSDMTFDMSVKFGKGLNANGYSTPFFVGDRAVRNRYSRVSGFHPHPAKTEFSVMSNNSLVNISYEISITVPTDFKFGGSTTSNEVKISAEGTYNRDSGVLCMIGCRKVGSVLQNSITNNTLDCEITVDIQFSPLDAKTNKDVKGTIESTRKKSDPLYFERLELSSVSIYSGQAEESIWRMDLEITMVLISKTLTCVFVGLQLFYVKSHPDVLPFTSIVMLIVLTAGHMIPLLLNFEAMFVSQRTPQNYFLGSGAWLETNEVIVRIVTMVAFLLQLRLLHQTWTSKKDDSVEKSLWGSERKVLYITLPLYICGALIAWLASHLKNSSRARIRAFGNPRRMTYAMTPFQRRSFQRRSLWEDLKSYAGLVMDGFLLPQILFNVFSDSSAKALAPLFYAGTTLVRLLPHAYDLYRARSFSPFLDLSYIYASHRMDFYSTAWDIVIPCGGLIFAALIFFQQRFGGRCILPRRFRESSPVYEKVSVISNDEL